VRGQISLIGAPSSAGAYSPGQEKAPAALREAGLVERLNRSGPPCADRGDVAEFRWRPDVGTPTAQNLEAVVRAATAVKDAVAAAAPSEFTLVLGGDCTVGIGTVAGQLSAGERLGLIYFDLHADLNVPTSTDDGALDWMGVAHILDVSGAIPELAALGPGRPLLGADQVVLLGFDPGPATAWERKQIADRSLRVVGIDEVAADPSRSAARARSMLEGSCDRLAVHFDVDVVDFLDAPLSENVERDGGLRLDQAIAALRVLLDTPRAAALTVTEVNPDHGDPQGAEIADLARGLAEALVVPERA
jgi:arginase